MTPHTAATAALEKLQDQQATPAHRGRRPRARRRCHRSGRFSDSNLEADAVMLPTLAVQLRFESSTGTRVDQRLMTRRHERSRSRIDFNRARSLRFARFIAPAIAGATMVPNPDGRPRLRSSAFVAPLGVSENL